jgi:hypothetical protein
MGLFEMQSSVGATHMLTRLELVDRAAVRALGVAIAAHIQIHLGVVVPELHVGFGAGAKDTALGVQVFGQKFYWVAHEQCLSIN